MGTPTVFDLEQAIARWRQGFVQSRSFYTNEVAELEHHVRDSIAAQMRTGLSAEAAFQEATRLLGHPDDLQDDFEAMRSPWARWFKSACWIIALATCLDLLLRYSSVELTDTLRPFVFNAEMDLTRLLTGLINAASLYVLFAAIYSKHNAARRKVELLLGLILVAGFIISGLAVRMNEPALLIVNLLASYTIVASLFIPRRWLSRLFAGLYAFSLLHALTFRFDGVGAWLEFLQGFSGEFQLYLLFDTALGFFAVYVLSTRANEVANTWYPKSFGWNTWRKKLSAHEH